MHKPGDCIWMRLRRKCYFRGHANVPLSEAYSNCHYDIRGIKIPREVTRFYGNRPMSLWNRPMSL